MIVSDELGKWLTDRTSQASARIASSIFGEDWARGEVHRRFSAGLAASGRAPSAEQVADAVVALFAQDDWLDALIGGLAERMRADPFFEPPFRHINSDIHKGLVVYEDQFATIAVGVSPAAAIAAKKNRARGATSVSLSGQVSVLKFIKAGQARLTFWTAPVIHQSFSAADAGLCRQTETRSIEDGDVLIIDGREQGYVIEQATTNLVVVQATVKPDQAPLATEYDSASGVLIGCSAADDSASRIQMITTLLRKLDCQAAFPVLAGFIDHPHFFVRWHVMREMLGLDAGRSQPWLEDMAAGDPHLENRRAAGAVLARLDPQRLDAQRKAA